MTHSFPGHPLRVALVAAVLALCPAAVRAQDGYKVIVNPANPASALPKSELSDLFLKKTTQWKDGQSVQPVDLADKEQTRQSFTKQVHGRPMTAVKAYWNQRLFSGRGTPPPEKDTDEEVVAFVRANPAAIGYVSAGAPTPGVKVVRVE